MSMSKTDVLPGWEDYTRWVIVSTTTKPCLFHYRSINICECKVSLGDTQGLNLTSKDITMPLQSGDLIIVNPRMFCFI